MPPYFSERTCAAAVQVVGGVQNDTLQQVPLRGFYNMLKIEMSFDKSKGTWKEHML